MSYLYGFHIKVSADFICFRIKSWGKCVLPNAKIPFFLLVLLIGDSTRELHQNPIKLHRFVMLVSGRRVRQINACRRKNDWVWSSETGKKFSFLKRTKINWMKTIEHVLFLLNICCFWWILKSTNVNLGFVQNMRGPRLSLYSCRIW